MIADLIDRQAFRKALLIGAGYLDEDTLMTAVNVLDCVPAVDAVEVSEIKAYLQRKLDEWNALGERKFEPANMWGYNFIMACFDDLSSYGERREDDEVS